MSQQSVFVSHVAGVAGIEPVRGAVESAGYRFVDGSIAADAAAAIRDSAFFVACFSRNADGTAAWKQSEVGLAIDELQKLRRTRDWFVVLKLAQCELPVIEVRVSMPLTGFVDIAANDLSALGQRIRRETASAINELNAGNVQIGRGEITALWGDASPGETNRLGVQQLIADDVQITAHKSVK